MRLLLGNVEVLHNILVLASVALPHFGALERLEGQVFRLGKVTAFSQLDFVFVGIIGVVAAPHQVQEGRRLERVPELLHIFAVLAILRARRRVDHHFDFLVLVRSLLFERRLPLFMLQCWTLLILDTFKRFHIGFLLSHDPLRPKAFLGRGLILQLEHFRRLLLHLFCT